MRDYVELIERTLDHNSTERSLQDHLLNLVESLYSELEAERNSTATLQETIKDFTTQETFGITAKFMSLKAAHATLREKLQSLQNENDDLHIQLIAKGEESKHLLTSKQEEIQSFYNNILQEKDEIIRKVEHETEIERKEFQMKQQALYNEIQAAEANANSKLDEMERNFRKQSSDSNKKLKDYIDTCTVLRMELMSVKEQFAEYKRASNEKLGLLQKRLTASPEPPSDYKPLNMSKKRAEENFNLRQVPEKTLPLLIPPKPASKKRKLFNPEDLSYLHD